MTSQQPTISTGPKTIRQRMATPTAVMIVLPALVAAVGLITGWIGHRNMTASARSMAQAEVASAAHQVDELCEGLASNASRLSERMEVLYRERQTSREPSDWFGPLEDLFTARPALSWLSVSYPDGTFLGMNREDDGSLCFTVQDQVEGGRRRDWRRDESRAIVTGGTRTQTGYDPRKRPFYAQAIEMGKSIWTDPYTFFDTGYTGVSLARPIFDEGKALLAVCTVDFTAAGISQTLDRMAGSLGDRLIVHTEAGAVVAVGGMNLKGREESREKPLELMGLDDPLIVPYAQNRQFPATVYTAQGDECFLAGESVTGDGLNWSVAVIANMEPRLALADSYLTRTVILTLIVVVVAAMIAALYASHLVRMRGIVRSARADAARAQEEAAELGSYVLEKKLGAGGMGEVWRARHRLLARPAALKLIKRDSEQANDESVGQRFEREARLTASLTSPHTVTVYDFGQIDDGTLFYAMELLEGEDLDGILRRNGAISQEAVVHVLLQVCDSLHEAHDAGLVHRDLKPANIFVARRGCADDVVKVLDFGLVALAGQRKKKEGPRLTMEGFVQGTPGFMAPEQLRDEDLDRRADIYALGCVAFWLLTGRAVFPADNLMDELRRHLEEDPPAPSSVTAQPIAPALDQLIQACLSRNRDDRPESALILRMHLLTCGVVPAWPTALGGGKRADVAATPATPTASVHLRVKRGRK